MKYKAILFDMDGTLLDTLADMVSAVNHILSVHGWPLRTTEEVRTFVGNGARRLVGGAPPPAVTGEDFEAVLAEYRDWYQAHNCVATAPYAGIPAVLAALDAAGIKTAVVSNKPDATTKTLAARFFPGLPAFGQRDDVPPKPAPEAPPEKYYPHGRPPRETAGHAKSAAARTAKDRGKKKKPPTGKGSS